MARGTQFDGKTWCFKWPKMLCKWLFQQIRFLEVDTLIGCFANEFFLRNLRFTGNKSDQGQELKQQEVGV
jgi:hypothetical protein